MNKTHNQKQILVGISLCTISNGLLGNRKKESLEFLCSFLERIAPGQAKLEGRSLSALHTLTFQPTGLKIEVREKEIIIDGKPYCQPGPLYQALGRVIEDIAQKTGNKVSIQPFGNPVHEFLGQKTG